MAVAPSISTFVTLDTSEVPKAAMRTWGLQVEADLAAALGGATNLILNGDFLFNQRVFLGGAVAAGAYCFDRWKAGAGGATITAVAYDVNVTGPITQVIEAVAWGTTTFLGVPMTVSLEAPSANVDVSLGGATGTVTAGAGRRSVTLTPTIGGNITLSLQRSGGGSVFFRRVKCEVGTVATPWTPRPYALEQALCGRYFVAGASTGYILGQADAASTWLAQFMAFPGIMRAVPTLTFSNPHNADASLSVLVGTFRGGSTVAAASATTGFNAYTTVTGGGMTAGAVYLAQGRYFASAEL